MSGASAGSPAWGEAFGWLWGAESVADAQDAAAELVLVVVPGGSAVELSSVALVAGLRAQGQLLATHRHRAYVLGVLLVMGTWLGAWQRAATTNSRLTSAAKREQAIASELSGFCAESSGLLLDDDPETRSMMGLLIGAASSLSSGPELLIGRHVGRLDDVQAGVLAPVVAGLLEGTSAAVLARANLELAGIWWTPSERAKLSARLSIPASQVAPVLWPAEEI